MRTLAIETSGRIGSIALADCGALRVERTFPHGLKHAAGLLPLIAGACDELSWKSSDIHLIAVSIGPGSFTGLRIGVTLAKTLAWATGAQVVAVPTTRVLVENAPLTARNTIIVLDAKRDQIFTARFERTIEEEWVERDPARLDTLTAALANSPRPVYLLGEGLPYHDPFIPTNDPGVIVSPPECWRARAGVVAQLGWAMARRQKFADIMRLSPLYVRKPEAEEKADKIARNS